MRHFRSKARARFHVEPLENRTLLTTAGTLDTSFGSGGTATFPIPGVTTIGFQVAVQTDGKIVEVGTTSLKGLTVFRYNADGTHDTTFNGSGALTFNWPTSSSGGEATAIGLQSDGSIIVGGTDSVFDADSANFWLARVSPAGAIDTTFNSGGGHPGFASYNQDGLFGGTRIAVQSDNKIVMVAAALTGSLFSATNYDFIAVRFNSGGTLDKTFGNSGQDDIGMGQDELPGGVAIDTNGTAASNAYFGDIEIVGTKSNSSNGNGRFAFVRLLPSGKLDSRFDSDGSVSYSFPNNELGIANALAIEPGGYIVAAGYVVPPGSTARFGDIALMRVDPFGKLDTSFGPSLNGTVITKLGGNAEADDIIVGNTGNLIVSGQASSNSALLGYTPNGLVDSSFGTKGQASSVKSSEFISLAKYPQRRFVAINAAFGNVSVSRYFDDVPTVMLSTLFNTTAYEQGSQSVDMFFYMAAAQPVDTRIYYSLSGTATPPPAGFLLRGNYDYTLSPLFVLAADFRSVVIPAGQTNTTLTLTPRDDTLVEGNEIAIVGVAANTFYDIGSPNSATITIVDNDGATVKTINTIADAYVKDGSSSNTNFGTATDLESKNNTGLDRNTYIKFDLSSVTTINSAKLELFGELNNANQTNVGVSVFSATDTSWTETGITWNNKPATGTTALATTTIVNTAPTLYTWDVTAYLQAQKAAGHNIVTLVLKNLSVSDPFAGFQSREAGGFIPQLDIT